MLMSTKVLVRTLAFIVALEEAAALFLVRRWEFLRRARISEIDGYLNGLELWISGLFEAKLMVFALCWGLDVDDFLVLRYVHHTVTSPFIKFIVNIIRIESRDLRRLFFLLHDLFGLCWYFLVEFGKDSSAASAQFARMSSRLFAWMVCWLLSGGALRNQVLRYLIVEAGARRSFGSPLSRAHIKVARGGPGRILRSNRLGLPRSSALFRSCVKRLFGLSLHKLSDSSLRCETFVIRFFILCPFGISKQVLSFHRWLFGLCVLFA